MLDKILKESSIQYRKIFTLDKCIYLCESFDKIKFNICMDGNIVRIWKLIEFSYSGHDFFYTPFKDADIIAGFKSIDKEDKVVNFYMDCIFNSSTRNYECYLAQIIGVYKMFLDKFKETTPALQSSGL